MGRAKLAHAGRTNAALVRADASQLPFRDGSVDAITVSFGLHELPTAVRERAVQEAARVLRRGGVLVIADLDRPPRFGWLVDAYFRLGEPAHAREIIGDGLARLLRAAGFAVEREGPHGAVPMQILTARPSGRLRRALRTVDTERGHGVQCSPDGLSVTQGGSTDVR